MHSVWIVGAQRRSGLSDQWEKAQSHWINGPRKQRESANFFKKSMKNHWNFSYLLQTSAMFLGFFRLISFNRYFDDFCWYFMIFLHVDFSLPYFISLVSEISTKFFKIFIHDSSYTFIYHYSMHFTLWVLSPNISCIVHDFGGLSIA